MDKNLSFWPFWGEAFLSSFKSAFAIGHGVTLAATVIFGVADYYKFNWAEYMNLILWQIALGAFILSLIISLIVKAYSLYKQKANKVDELNSKRIDLVVVSGDKQYLRTRNNGKTLVGRVGIKTSGMKTIEDVGVKLCSFDNTLNQYKDSYLNPADCQLNQTATFDVHPSDVPKFVEVFTWQTHIPDDPLGICYYLNYQNGLRLGNAASSPYAIFTNIDTKEGKKHKLVLQVTGKDIPPVTKDFIFEITEGRLIWDEAPKNNQV